MPGPRHGWGSDQHNIRAVFTITALVFGSSLSPDCAEHRSIPPDHCSCRCLGERHVGDLRVLEYSRRGSSQHVECKRMEKKMESGVQSLLGVAATTYLSSLVDDRRSIKQQKAARGSREGSREKTKRNGKFLFFLFKKKIDTENKRST